MNFSDKWVCQSNWNENLAAVFASFCRLHEMEISRKEIFSHFVNGVQMAHFDEIGRFCKKWKIEHLQLNFVKEHLEQEFLPAFILLEGYRSVLVMYVEGDTVHFVDGMRGWMEQSKEEFFKQSMGYIVLVEPKDYMKDPNFAFYEKQHQDEIDRRKSNFEISVVDNFMSAEECDRLADLGEEYFERSTVVSLKEGENSELSEARTSFSAYLTFKNKFLDEIRERGAKLLKIEKERFESVQLTTYSKGQQYEIHTDAFVTENDLKEGQRTHTILVYLKDDFEGGATLFPAIETSVKAKKGTAVVWRSLDENGKIDFRGYHGGLPVRSGRKTISNLWIRDRKQKNWDQNDET